MSTAAETFIALRTTDDEVCGCCGRTGLKRAILVGRLDADGAVTETIAFGTTCAARATGRRSADLVREAVSGDHARQAAAEDVAVFVAGIRAEWGAEAEAAPDLFAADVRAMARRRLAALGDDAPAGSFLAERRALLLAL